MAFLVWHDSNFPLCCREISLMRRLDWRSAFAFFDASDGRSACPRDRSELLARSHASEDGCMLSGAEAFAAMWRHIPLLRPPGLAPRQRACACGTRTRLSLVSARASYHRGHGTPHRMEPPMIRPTLDPVKSSQESAWYLARPSIAQPISAHLLVMLGGQTIAERVVAFARLRPAIRRHIMFRGTISHPSF